MTVQDKLHSHSSLHIPTNPTAPCIEQSLPHEACHQKEKLPDQTNSHPQINLIVKVSSEQVDKQNEPGKDKISRKVVQKRKKKANIEAAKQAQQREAEACQADNKAVKIGTQPKNQEECK